MITDQKFIIPDPIKYDQAFWFSSKQDIGLLSVNCFVHNPIHTLKFVLLQAFRKNYH
jgi:hypothetical protein